MEVEGGESNRAVTNFANRIPVLRVFKFCLRITLILCYWYSPFHLIPPSPLLTAFLLSSPLLTFEMQVKGGGWDSETGCIPFQYVCRTYAVAGENYDWMYEVY